MSDDASLLIFLFLTLFVFVLLIVWLAYIAAGLSLAFTEFVLNLPIIFSVIMFILFPPTLIVFLTGYAMLHFGIAEKIFRDKD